jgi:fibronectin-binding autotransporter adhesin
MMKPIRLLSGFAAAAMIWTSPEAARAQATWLTTPTSGSLTNPANWSGSFSNGGAWTFTNSSVTALTNGTTWTNSGLTFTPNATNSLASSNVSFALSGGTVTLLGDIVNQGTTTPTNNYSAVINGSIAMTNTTNGQIVWASGSSWTGSGTVTFGAASSAGRLTLNPSGATNMSGFTGALIANSGRINANVGGFSANADYTFNNSGGVFLASSNSTYNVGSLSGNATIAVNTTGVTNTVSIGAKNTSTSFSGNISTNQNGTINVIKTGTGTLTLSGSNNFTGTTAVNQGALIINGSLNGAGALSVSADATIGGTGYVRGAATISGAVAPGNSIGTLTVSNNLTWNATTNAWKFELGAAGISIGSPGTSDLLNITGDFLKGTGTTFTFDFQNTGAIGFYKLVDWTVSTGFTNADFSGSNLGSGLSVGGFTVDAATSALYLEVVPEPSTWALLALAAAGLGARALRRRRS